MDRKEQAVNYKHNGCNCTQAVLMAFCDQLDIPENQLKAIASGFGAGMGCMESTCGALIGANMVLGMKNDSGRPTVPMARDLLMQFKERCGGVTICGDLKGIRSGKVVCECDDCIRNAVALLQERGIGKE